MSLIPWRHSPKIRLSLSLVNIRPGSSRLRISTNRVQPGWIVRIWSSDRLKSFAQCGRPPALNTISWNAAQYLPRSISLPYGLKTIFITLALRQCKLRQGQNLIRDSNPGFRINRDPHVCLIPSKMHCIHSLVGVSHFAKYRQYRKVCEKS